MSDLGDSLINRWPWNWRALQICKQMNRQISEPLKDQLKEQIWWNLEDRVGIQLEERLIERLSLP